MKVWHLLLTALLLLSVFGAPTLHAFVQHDHAHIDGAMTDAMHSILLLAATVVFSCVVLLRDSKKMLTRIPILFSAASPVGPERGDAIRRGLVAYRWFR